MPGYSVLAHIKTKIGIDFVESVPGHLVEVSIARRQPVPKIKPISYDIEFNYPSPRGLIVSPAFCRHDKVDLVPSEKARSQNALIPSAILECWLTHISLSLRAKTRFILTS